MLLEAILWLALNVHHEARGEPLPCQIMVAEVTLRRVESQYYPDSIKDVVLEPKQFSWTSDKEKSMDFSIVSYKDVYVAMTALGGSYYTTDELHYARYDVDNYWTNQYHKSKQCGNHIFYYSGGTR